VKQAAHMILTLSLIGMLSGGVLALVSTWAFPLIAQRELEAKEAAIYQVQPEASSYEQVAVDTLEVYRVFDASGQPIGYSVVHGANGFQSFIRVMIGLSQDLNSVTAIEILDHNETPGLGTLVNDPDYKDQFLGLSTTPNIVWVKGIPAEAPNEVQTITGATISSRAVVEIVDDAVTELRAMQEELK
jgi:Na+-translocating ferredoxin:NAD+ oxidoreductase subunit G